MVDWKAILGSAYSEGMTDEEIKMFKYLLNKSLDNME